MSYKTTLFLYLALTTSFLSAHGQEWKKVITVPSKSPISNVSIDRYGLFYTANEQGNITKYDSTGVALNTYSPSKKADITLLEAWRNVNIFVYYRSFQEFVLLDRFLSPSPTTRLNESTIGFARLATYSYDNNLWLIDETDFSLKKYNLRFGKTELITPLDLLLDPSLYDLNYLHEYQNQVFLNDRNSGIFIFDNMGNYKTKIPIIDLNRVGFHNDEIYYPNGDSITFMNIYTYKERTEALPEKGPFLFVLYSNNRLYLFRRNAIEVYKR